MPAYRVKGDDRIIIDSNKPMNRATGDFVKICEMGKYYRVELLVWDSGKRDWKVYADKVDISLLNVNSGVNQND